MGFIGTLRERIMYNLHPGYQWRLEKIFESCSLSRRTNKNSLLIYVPSISSKYLLSI
uniref:Uncharacterized protein n=4 Tax=Cercopithecinae TaxID=9528 RepID=A0A2K5KYE9_CERAT|nr:unnamed protein product [Macaca fascicularis]